MYFVRMCFSEDTYGSGVHAAFFSMLTLSAVLTRVESRCNLRFGRAVAFVLEPFVIGAGWVCAGPGSLLAALEGEDAGGPAFPVAFVCIETFGFFVFVAVPVLVAVGFDMIAM